MTINPYAPPATSMTLAPAARAMAQPHEMPAGRGARLGATLIDTLLLGVGLIGVGIDAFGNVGRAVAMAYTVVLAAVQLYGFLAHGQSLGKRAYNIKVIRYDGSRPNLGTFVLRNVVISLVGQIPVVGPVTALSDVGLIFDDERRCLHDRIAATRVIVA